MPSVLTNTDLNGVPRESGRDADYLCGRSAAGGVLAAYFGALDRDFMAFLVEGALLSHDSLYDEAKDIRGLRFLEFTFERNR